MIDADAFVFPRARFVAARLPWMLNLTTRMVARSLNMPEPMLHHTGAFVFAQMQAVENSLIVKSRGAIRKFKDRLASLLMPQDAA
jgi:hypothetical protein